MTFLAGTREEKGGLLPLSIALTSATSRHKGTFFTRQKQTLATHDKELF